MRHRLPQPRTPKGSPEAGQWAPSSRSESEVSLGSAWQTTAPTAPIRPRSAEVLSADHLPRNGSLSPATQRRNVDIIMRSLGYATQYQDAESTVYGKEGEYLAVDHANSSRDFYDRSGGPGQEFDRVDNTVRQAHARRAYSLEDALARLDESPQP